ncbi:MAG: copper homeostasis protein CutC [Lachnospiraceae bacterium]|nr:copper homeostasis protein CutC [Lachnospiraceae bacterium]
MGNKFLLECATDSVESALAAAKGGADRLELCANLIIGGTTPTLALYDEVRSHSDIPLFILIRPRFGDFLYTDYEANVICREIEMFQKAGAEGVVIGSLNKDGSLNAEHMKRFIDSAKDMSVTLHRAFDMCADPFETLKQAKELGVNTILTSGQAPSSLEGIDLYEKLIEKANGEISILAGGGIKASTIEKLLKQTSLTAFHMSGKIVVESGMEFRNPAVSMGLPGISEYNIWLTDENNVREARRVLDEAAKK